jgi:hypothetical protein
VIRSNRRPLCVTFGISSLIIIRWPKPIITPCAYRRSSNTTADTALPPTRHRHHRQRHRHCHRSAGRSCLYVERAPSPLPLHVVASWKGPPSSLQGKGLTRLLLMILSVSNRWTYVSINGIAAKSAFGRREGQAIRASFSCGVRIVSLSYHGGTETSARACRGMSSVRSRCCIQGFCRWEGGA